ncbi:hypothetical protein [Limnoglobus roseus]|uniref:Uncharacterized protein n=1 Tax=Limnoglobus roseus TaxID=2598579 RepID=A0A5C1AKH7_9BACT|nr:hypothetical protein [Limnoglobus roseus]QEL19410.1 hypothetical protein PX52LOC_06481 [Limnoglobus roseus]
MPHPELEFFNSLTGKLEIELDTPAEPVANLLNLQASPDARIVRLELKAEVFDRETDESRPLTPAELDGVAFRGSSILLQSEDGEPVSHAAPNGSHFTVRELLRAVEETERQTRGGSEWLGGVDVHHVYFEGIHSDDGDVWEVDWGS